MQMYNYLFLLAFSCLLSSSLFGQSQEDVRSLAPRELGVQLSGLNDFSIIYKKQRKPNKYTRYRALLFNSSYINANGNNVGRVNLEAAMGWESRKPIARNLWFIHGPEINAGVNLTTGNGTNTFIVSGIGYLLGAHCQLTDQLGIHLEMIPRIQSNVYVQDGSADRFDLNLIAGTSQVAIGAVYCFTPNPKT
jgi:hypothetical protein